MTFRLAPVIHFVLTQVARPDENADRTTKEEISSETRYPKPEWCH
jgi:hypothetical protein